MLCIPINVIGILYILFVLKEVQPKDDTYPEHDDSATHSPRPTILINNPGVDNPTFELNDTDNEHMHSYQLHGRARRSTVHVIKEKIEKNWCVQFFNPIVAIDCIRVIVKHRAHNGRKILILLLVMYFIAIGPAYGKEWLSTNQIKLLWIF